MNHKPNKRKDRAKHICYHEDFGCDIGERVEAIIEQFCLGKDVVSYFALYDIYEKKAPLSDFDVDPSVEYDKYDNDDDLQHYDPRHHYDHERDFDYKYHCPSLEYYVHQYSFDPIPCNDYGSQVLKHYDPRYHYDHQRNDRTADDEAVVCAFRKWQKGYR